MKIAGKKNHQPQLVINCVNCLHPDKSYNDDPYKEHEEEINSLDDCIDGIEEPTYGFVAEVTLVDAKPCVLGSTCRGEVVESFEDECLRGNVPIFLQRITIPVQVQKN